MKTPRTWYVVADGGRARFLQKRNPRRSFAAPHQMFATDREFVSAHIHDRSSDLGTAPPGRSYESAGFVRHGVQPREDLHRTEKRNFVDEVAAALNDANAGDEFDRLILVAPAHALSEFRRALDGSTQRKIAGELQKDLTHVPEADLAEHLADLDGACRVAETANVLVDPHQGDAAKPRRISMEATYRVTGSIAHASSTEGDVRGGAGTEPRPGDAHRT